MKYKKQLRIVLQIIFILGTIGGCGGTDDKVNISSENSDLNSFVVEETDEDRHNGMDGWKNKGEEQQYI